MPNAWDDLKQFEDGDFLEEPRAKPKRPIFASPGFVPMIEDAPMFPLPGPDEQAAHLQKMTSDVNKALATEMDARRKRAKEERDRAEREREQSRLDTLIARMREARKPPPVVQHSGHLVIRTQ